MGREVKRIPMDFVWPRGRIWPGYLPDRPLTEEEADNPEIWQRHPPTGPGYQLWENATEGSPQSPVFGSVEELAQWCEGNATTFGDCWASKETWQGMIEAGQIYGQIGNLRGI